MGVWNFFKLVQRFQRPTGTVQNQIEVRLVFYWKQYCVVYLTQKFLWIHVEKFQLKLGVMNLRKIFSLIHAFW